MLNRQTVFKLLYDEQKLTRRKLSELSGLSLPTVSQITSDLADMGLVDYSGQMESTGGRRPSICNINTEARLSIGISFSMHYVRFAALNLGKSVIAESEHEITFSDTAAYWDLVYEKYCDFVSYNSFDSSILLGIGVSFPGIIDHVSHSLDFAPTLEIRSLNLNKLKKYYGINFLAENDAYLAAQAELWFKPLEYNAVYLLLNRAIGGAIISKGGVSPFGTRSGEFGHMVIEKDGKPCLCGNRGCFETYCSASVIYNDGGSIPLREFFGALSQGNERFEEIWRTYCDYLVVALTNIRCIFDCDIIIGGEMSRYIEEYSDMINDRLIEKSIFKDEKPYIRFSNYGQFDSAIGAALLQINKFIESV